MPLVLMQRAWRDDPKYKDTEFCVYHYPRQYFDQIHGGERFVYYRPSRDAKAGEASAYFGCGELGDWWPDPGDPNHRFVGIRRPIRFATAVPHLDSQNRMYESTFTSRNAFQGRSVRYIHDLDHHRSAVKPRCSGRGYKALDAQRLLMIKSTCSLANLRPGWPEVTLVRYEHVRAVGVRRCGSIRVRLPLRESLRENQVARIPRAGSGQEALLAAMRVAESSDFRPGSTSRNGSALRLRRAVSCRDWARSASARVR